MLCHRERLLGVPSGTAGKARQWSQTLLGLSNTHRPKLLVLETPKGVQGSGDTHTVGRERAPVAALTWLGLCACLRAVWAKKCLWCSHKGFFPHIEF